MNKFLGLAFVALAALVVLLPWQQSRLLDVLRVLGVVALLTLWCLHQAFRRIQVRRVMQDMPTSRVATAAQGFVELAGQAAAADESAPAVPGAPLWSSVRVDRRTWGDDHAVKVLDNTNTQPLALDDGSGRCLVFPAQAELFVQQDFLWYGGKPQPDGLPGAAARWLSRLALGMVFHKLTGWVFLLCVTLAFMLVEASPAIAFFWGFVFFLYHYLVLWLAPYRYRLRMIRAGDSLYALGRFQTRAGDGQHSLEAPDAGQPFVVSTLTETELARQRRRGVFPYLAVALLGWVLLGGLLWGRG